jgi:uncharacterized membrane protein YgaE (UPF0421/DUF939 family)
MTGNLTNATLSAMNVIFGRPPSTPTDIARLKASLRLLIGFFSGCVLAAIAVAYFGDSAWALPVVLAAIAMLLR